mgnify:CR=1 FL=1
MKTTSIAAPIVRKYVPNMENESLFSSHKDLGFTHWPCDSDILSNLTVGVRGSSVGRAIEPQFDSCLFDPHRCHFVSTT